MTQTDTSNLMAVQQPVIVASALNSNSFPATEAQLEIWLSNSQSIEASCAYNEVSTIILRGDLDRHQLVQALESVVERHDSLRSTFSNDGLQVIVHKEAKFGYEYHDLSQLHTLDVDEKCLEVVQREACTPFDLENGPLIRCVLQQVQKHEHRLTIAAHHIVLDGWSLAVLCRDLGQTYDALVKQGDPALPKVSQYKSYAADMTEYFRSEQGRSDEQYWCNQYADSIPVLNLPTERVRPNLRTYYGRRYDHFLSAELVASLRSVGAKSGCSLFNTLLASFQAYLARLSGDHDFCVGIPTAGQSAMDHLELIGHCVNTLPLRCQVDIDRPFVEQLKSSRANLLDALEHQRYSFGQLLRKLAPPRDPSRPPMLSVSFNLDPMIDTSEMGFGDLAAEVVIEPRSFENFEWFVNGVILADQSVELQVQYNADLYSRQSMEFYFNGFEVFLQEIVRDPMQAIAQLPMMSISQRKQVISDWNQTGLEYPSNSTLHAEFAKQVERSPNATAVQFGDRQLSYLELEQRSNQVAHLLKQKGVSAGELVGVCVERNEQMLVVLYAIMKTGAGYVPLDPDYPAERLQFMCDHSQLKMVVSQSQLDHLAQTLGKPWLAIDTLENEIDSMPVKPLEVAVEPTSTCYVIYTSGSTGKPKGVQVPHGSVVNFLYSMQREPGFTAADSVLAVTTLSFDIAVLELYLPTITGGRVIVVDRDTASDGMLLSQALEDFRVTMLQATPATWRLLIQSGWSGKTDLKVLCGGEPMPRDLVGPLLERCQQLWNMYGPTETTVWSASYQIKSESAPILIGKPIGNTQIYVLDDRLGEVPVGCEGEVYIGGAGVTLGYLGRSDLTAERFVENPYFDPFAEYINPRLYKTGDVARFRFDGNIEFLRRNDKQVKVRGFRIELGEIEQSLESHPDVQQGVVIVREDKTGDARLTAYFVASEPIEIRQLKAHLREQLPYYMVPQHLIVLEKFPQTDNGKIDYKSLPAPDETQSPQVLSSLPESAAEKFLAQIWCEVLECDEVRVEDNFFEVGGHSLLVMNVIKRVEESTSVRLGPQDFLAGSLQQLASRLDGVGRFADASPDMSPDENNASMADWPRVEPNVEKQITSEAERARSTEESKSGAGLFRRLTGFWEVD